MITFKRIPNVLFYLKLLPFVAIVKLDGVFGVGDPAEARVSCGLGRRAAL